MAAAISITQGVQPSTPAKDPCTWTALIVAMRSISRECEMAAWKGRSLGLTARQFADYGIIALSAD